MSEEKAPDVAGIAGRLSAYALIAILECGDVADRLPCKRCGGTTLKACNIHPSDRAAASAAINQACAVVNGDGLHVLRNHLMEKNDVQG